jgi:histidinol-phosphate aminotransferase
MARRGILIRDRSSDPGREGCVRTTVGTREQMDHVLATLEDTVREMPIGERSLA